MRIQCLQHAHFEGPGSIDTWAAAGLHRISVTRLYANEPFPQWDEFDWLIIMGGPMSVNDIELYPWITAEKQFIEQAVQRNRIVIGICLGAQLIASVLGSRVFPTPCKEIGWYPITLTDEAMTLPEFRTLPQRFQAFHWHGETFELPQGAVRIAGSQACPDQAFKYGSNVFALQFHLESTRATVQDLIQNCAVDIVEEPYVMCSEEMLSDEGRFLCLYNILSTVLGSIRQAQKL